MKPQKLRWDRLKRYIVSTVALDKDDPSYGYESMVFDRARTSVARTMGDQVYCRRYETEEAAVRGHEQLVREIDRGWIP